MSTSHVQKFFNSDGCLSRAGLKSLHSGEVTDEVRTLLLAHTKECLFCSDALQGLKLAGQAHFDAAYDELNRRFSYPAEQQPGMKNNASIFKPFRLKPGRRALKYAASLLLLATTGVIALISIKQINTFSRRHLSSNVPVSNPLAYPENVGPQINSEGILTYDIIMLPPSPARPLFDDGTGKPVSSPPPRVVAEVMPEYTGSMTEKISGKYTLLNMLPIDNEVYLCFVVETDGSMSSFSVMRGSGELHNHRAASWLADVGRWTPGLHHNQPVRMLVSCKVAFEHGIMKIKKC